MDTYWILRGRHQPGRPRINWKNKIYLWGRWCKGDPSMEVVKGRVKWWSLTPAPCHFVSIPRCELWAASQLNTVSPMQSNRTESAQVWQAVLQYGVKVTTVPLHTIKVCSWSWGRLHLWSSQTQLEMKLLRPTALLIPAVVSRTTQHREHL